MIEKESALWHHISDREKEEIKQSAKKTDAYFREIMLRNAPKTKGDCIEAEKGGWT